MKQTFAPSTPPPAPAPSGPPLAARILISLAVFGLGAATGWVLRGMLENEGGREGGGPRPAGWTFQPLAVSEICGPDADSRIRTLLPTKPTPLPLRLSDHMPDASPVGAYERAYDGPLTDLSSPWQKPHAFHGVQRAYARTFNNQSAPGGFTVYAYEFPSPTDATAAAVDAYRAFVCDFGADPVVVREQPGIAGGVRPTQSTVAWWVHDRRLIEVSYSMYGDEEEDVAAALTVLRSVWENGRAA